MYQGLLLCVGGLVCRGILETTPDHNVYTFISLSSPQAGQFGGIADTNVHRCMISLIFCAETEYLNSIFPEHTTESLYE